METLTSGKNKVITKYTLGLVVTRQYCQVNPHHRFLWEMLVTGKWRDCEGWVGGERLLNSAHQWTTAHPCPLMQAHDFSKLGHYMFIGKDSVWEDGTLQTWSTPDYQKPWTFTATVSVKGFLVFWSAVFHWALCAWTNETLSSNSITG